jgi:Formin Homology 2 Domain/Subunit CCDC53 of WASH complex
MASSSSSSSSRHAMMRAAAEQAPPAVYSSSGRSNNRMILEAATAVLENSSSPSSAAGAASRRRNMAFLKYGSQGMPKKSAKLLQKSREHARQIANITPTPWDTTDSTHAQNIDHGDLFNNNSHNNDFLAAKIHKAEQAALGTFGNSSTFTSAATLSAGHKKSSSSRREREKSKSGIGRSSSSRNHYSNHFTSTDASFAADFGNAFASSSSSSSQLQQQQQQPQHHHSTTTMSDVNSSFHSEASSALSFFADDPFANVRTTRGIDDFTAGLINNNLQTSQQQQQQQQQQQRIISSSSRRGGNISSTQAAALNTRENRNHHSAPEPELGRNQQPQQQQLPHFSPPPPAAAAAAASPRTMSMSTMPSNSSMQRAFVHQQQQHQQQAETAAAVSSAMARRKMRSQQKNGGSGSSITSQSSQQQPQQLMGGSNRTPPQSPYSNHYSVQPPQRGVGLQHQGSVSSNNSRRSDSSAGATSIVGSGGGGGGGGSTASNGSVNLFSHPSTNANGDDVGGGIGFTFDAFGLDASQMNAQLNQAMHELAGSHPDLSFFVDDDFGSTGGGGGGQQPWDYASQSPTMSRSSTPPPPATGLHNNNKHGAMKNASIGTNDDSTTDMDDEEGFVDGFRVTKQAHLPMHVRNSPCSTERSSLTSESSANNVNNNNNNTSGGGGGGGVNLFKEKAAFHTSKRPRKFVRPSERVDEATSPKPKQSLGSPQRHHAHAAAHFNHFQSQSPTAAAAIQKRQDGFFQQPTHLPSMPDLNNSNNSSRLTMTRGAINTASVSSALESSRHRGPRREDVEFVDVNSDSDFSAGGGVISAKTGATSLSSVQQTAATVASLQPNTTTSSWRGYAGSSSNYSAVSTAARGKTALSGTVSAAARMTARMSASSSSPARTVASLRLNAATAAALLPNHHQQQQQQQQRKQEHPSSLDDDNDEWSQTQEPHDDDEDQQRNVEASHRGARSEVNAASSSSRNAYSNMSMNAASSRRAYSDVNGAGRVYSDMNAAASDVGGSNIPSDVGLASDVGPPPSSVGAAFENIPKEVVSREKQLKKGSADTATTETSSVMQYEEKKEEDLLTPGTPEKNVGSLRARWEKQESTSSDSKTSTLLPSPRFRQQQQQQPPGPSSLNSEHIEKLQTQLREENVSTRPADPQQRPELSYRPGIKSPHIRQSEERAQQHQPSASSDRERFSLQQQQQRLSPRRNHSPSSPQQRYNASKSEGGAAHTRFRPSHINSAINRIQSPQSSVGTPRDARSDTGAPSPSFLQVKLRKTGNAPKESPSNSDNDRLSTDPSSSYKPPLSPKPSFQYSKESPPASPTAPYQYSRQQPPGSPASRSSSRAESPPPASPQAEDPPERKMTYRERRELELQWKRDEELRQQEKEQANAAPELDVASLIKRRIAANKKTGDNSPALSSPRDLPPRYQPMQLSSVELPPKPYSRQNSQREKSTERVAREPSPDRFATEPSTRQYARDEMKDSLSKILTERQSTAPQRSRNKDYEHSDSRDLSIEEAGPTQNESTEPSAAISRLLLLQQLQARIPQEPASAGLQTDASSRQDSEDYHHRSSTPKATKMMLNAFLAGRDSIASADGASHADAVGEGYSDEKSAGPLSTLPALKDDPQYERYFKMLKLGMPIEVVKHAMIRDGLDSAIIDGDPNKPVMVGIPLKEDPDYQKYFKMLKIGMPMEAVKHAMLRDGLDCSVMDQDHSLPLQKAKSEDDHDEPKEKDSHRRARLHWKTLRKVTSNSLWAKLDQEVSFQDIDIDEDEFQQLFQAERGEAPAPKASSNAVGGRGVHVRVIDPKRANNGGIILARLKMSHDDMADAVDRINEQALTAEQIEHIIEFLPSKEERKALESYMLEGGQDAAEKFDGLCECEKFMVSMMTVKHAKRKVRALLFKLQFENCLDDILQDTLAVEAACDELSNSIRLRQLLGIILTFGNRLNTAGNKKRRAGAFTLDSLLKLNQAKAFDKKTTFLHYIILIVQRNNELLLRFKDDLPTVFKADKVFWDQCLSDLEEVESQLENVRKIALHQARQSHSYRLRRRKQRDDDGSESLSDDEVSLSLEEEVEALRATPIGTFTLNAIKYASSLRDKVEETQGKLSRLLEYFGEEDKNMASHELFSIIVNFSRDFDKAKEQVFSNEKRKMREERKHKSTRGKPPTHSPGPPIERKMLKASSHQPTFSGVLRGQQSTSYVGEPPGDLKRGDPYGYRSSGIDSSQLPVIEDNNYHHSYNHPNAIMESSSQNSVTAEDDDRFKEASGEQHAPIHDARYIVSDQQRRYEAASTSEDQDKTQFHEEVVRPPEMSSNEDVDVGQEELRPHTPVRTRPGPDTPLTPTGYHRVQTPTRQRSATPEQEPSTLCRSSPSLRRQRYTPTPQEEESKNQQIAQEEEGRSVGRSSPSVGSTGSATKASMRHKARMRRRRQSATQSSGAIVEPPQVQEARSTIQSPSPVAEEDISGLIERDLSPVPSDTISQSSAISSTLSPRSTFRHRRRMEVRDRLQQKAGN